MRRALLVVILLLVVRAPVQAATREVLPNGLRLLVLPSPSTEVVAATVLFAIPVSADPQEEQGLRYLTHRLLLRGTRGESGEAMGRRLAAVGGRVSVNCTLDYVEVTVEAPSDGFEAALDLLAKAVQDPAFAPEELVREKERAQTAARAAEEDPFSAAYQAVREELYGPEGYGRWSLGDSRAMSGITREEVVAFYREHYRPEVAVLAIAGGVEAAAATRTARLRFENWHGVGEEARAPEPEEPAPLTCSAVVARARETERFHLVFGFPAPAVGERHYYAMQVIQGLLGGGSTARLPKALREEAGLVYDVSCFYPTLAGGSHFGLYAETDEGCVEEVKKEVLAQLERLRDEPVSQGELARAKRRLLGAYVLSQQEASSQACSAAWYELLGRPPDFAATYQEQVRAVTGVQVQEAARDLIHYLILAVTAPAA